MIRVFLCEDSLTGILTGVYDAWASRMGHAAVRLKLRGEENLELFCEYEETAPDTGKAGKVISTVRRRMGEKAFGMIACAAACPHEGKADAIYRMIVLGLHLERGEQIMGMLTQKDVHLVFELSRRAWNIAHRYMGFVRFRELNTGLLFSEIDPEADILSLIAPHFSDRLSIEDWVIYDRRRKKAAVHPKEQTWMLLEEVDEEVLRLPEDSREEERYQALWRGFHRAVSIASRENLRCQQSFLPYKFRTFMTEFGR